MYTPATLCRSLRAVRRDSLRRLSIAACAVLLTGPAFAETVQIAWADLATTRVQRARADGSVVRDVVTGYEARDVAFNHIEEQLYVVTTNDVYRGRLDGTNFRHIYNGMDAASGIALDMSHGKMYVTDGGYNRIVRTNLDGSGSEALIDRGLDNPTGLALDVSGGKLYWSDWGTRKIQRANLDGTQVEDLVTTGLIEPQYLDLDLVARKMYWTDRGADVIRRANFDGSQIEDVIATGDLAHGIKLDTEGGKIYWTDRSLPAIQRANMDGTGLENLVTFGSNPDLDRPLGIVLLPIPEPPGLLLAACGAVGAWFFLRR